MISIRRATPLDRQELIRLAVQFATTEPYATLFAGIDAPTQLAKVVDLLFSLDERAAVFVAVDDDDVPYAGLAICENVNLITGERFADELAWFVHPSQRSTLRVGPRLLVVAENWATTRCLGSIKMVAPIPSVVGKFYTRAGYQAIETAYRKVL